MIRYWRNAPDDPQVAQPGPLRLEPDDAYQPPPGSSFAPAMLAAALSVVACGQHYEERPQPTPLGVEFDDRYAPPRQVENTAAQLVSALFSVNFGEAQDDPQYPQPPPLAVDDDYAPRWTRVWRLPGQGMSVGSYGASAAPTLAFEEDAWWWDVIYPQPSTPTYARLYLPDPYELDLPLPIPQDVEPDWFIPVLLGSPTLPPPLILRNVEDDIPAGSLYGVPEEEAWIPPFPSTVIGSVTGQWPTARIYLPDPDEVDLPLAAQDDGGPDWVIPVLLASPQLPPPLWLRNVEDDIPAGSLFGTPDADETWSNPVQPIAGFNRVPPPLWEQEELPAGSLTGQPDEDTPPPLPAPIPPRHWQPLPYAPDGSQDVPALSGVPEEDAPSPARPWASQTVLAVTADDDLPVTPTSVDEDFWSSGVQPTAPANRVSLPWEPEADELSAVLSGTPDADETWINYVAPVPGSLGRLYLPDPEEISAGFLIGAPDLDEVWRNPVAPVPASHGRLYLQDPEELSAGFLAGTVDEDFWISGVAPIPPVNRISLPWEPEADELPGSLSGTPDADEQWQNWVAPVPATLGRLYLPDPEELAAATLYGVPDEDTPALARAWVAAPVVRAFAADDESPTLATVDEDFWISGVAPVAPANRVSLPWEPDLDEGVNAATLTGTPDEDFGPPLPAPVQASNRVSLPIGDADSETPALYGAPEEDQFSPARPWPLATARAFADTDEVPTPPTVYQLDEDFWTSGVAPVVGSNRVSLPLVDVEELPAGFLFGAPDVDDAWINPVRPVVAADYITPAWQPDVEEIPAADLFGEFDEDFAGPLPAPVQAKHGKLYLPDPEEISAGALTGVPEEDSTAPRPAPVVAADFLVLPFAPDVEELPAASFTGQPDEDFPAARPAPVVASNYIRPGWLPDQDEDVTALSGVPEDDAYRAPILPVALVLIAARVDDDFPPQTLPPDEDFWNVPIGKSPPLPPVVFLDGAASEWVPFISTQIVEDEPYLAPVTRPTGNFFALPYLPDANQDAPPLFCAPEEDSTAPLPTQTRFPALPVRAFAETDEPPAGTLFGTPDADERWQNWVAPVPASLGRLYLPDPEELPAGSLSGMPDEDFPGPVPAPVQAANYQRLPYLPDGEDLPVLSGVPEEDRYQAPIFGLPPIVLAKVADDEVTTAPITDEDYWINGVAPVAARHLVSLPRGLIDPEEIPAARLRGQDDEDFSTWPKPVPVVAANYQRLPYLPDVEELPAGFLRGPAEEDFPGPLPAPVPGRHGRLYLPDPEEIDAGSLAGQLDEDFPGPLPAPVPPRSLVVFSHVIDLQDDWVPYISVSLGMDEDFYAPPRPWEERRDRPYTAPPRAEMDDDGASSLFHRALSVSYNRGTQRWKRDPVPYRLPSGGGNPEDPGGNGRGGCC